MKKLQIWQILLLLPLLVLGACDSDDDPVDPDPDPVVTDLMINEFMASNDSYDVDLTGDFPDWIELYNTTDTDIDVGGYYMTDSITDDVADWFMIPTGSAETVVPAGGWLVLFANGSPEDGNLYLDFKLGSSGESIGLADADQVKIVSFEYEQQTTDVSMGLSPDGSATAMVFMATATPGVENLGAADNMIPAINDVDLDPVSPSPDTDVTVIASVFDDHGISSVKLFWNVDGGDWTEVAMTTTAKVTGDYSAVIPGQAVDSVVGYYVEATDTDAETVTSPEDAPTGFNTYVPVFQLSFTLHINEFMAKNNTAFAAPGEYEDPEEAFVDWVEFYNPGDEDLAIGGMFMTNDVENDQLFQISNDFPESTTVAAGGFLVMYADEDLARGVMHLNMKLSAGGGVVRLFADDGLGNILMVDGYSFSDQEADISEGRTTDGGDDWAFFATSTPGASNNAVK